MLSQPEVTTISAILAIINETKIAETQKIEDEIQHTVKNVYRDHDIQYTHCIFSKL